MVSSMKLPLLCIHPVTNRYNLFIIQDEEPVPFSFHVKLPENKNAPADAATQVVISKSIETDVLGHPTGDFTTEDIIVVHCSPQSVFRVRPATRCSSTLSGVFFYTLFVLS